MPTSLVAGGMRASKQENLDGDRGGAGSEGHDRDVLSRMVSERRVAGDKHPGEGSRREPLKEKRLKPMDTGLEPRCSAV